MFYKYLNLILFSTLLLQASPKVFNSLGDELEEFQDDCKEYQKLSSLPTTIKKKCKVFNSKTNQAFKVGYALDPYADSGNINEKKLNKYLKLLRNLDKRKENILEIIYSKAKKARKQNNFKSYSQLISNNKVKLYSSDYEFMKKNKDVFIENTRYISHMRYRDNLAEQIRTQNTPTKNEEIIVMQKKEKNNKPPALLDKFDFVVMTSSIKDNLLDVHFFYTDRETNKQVRWDDSTIIVNCEAYTNIGQLYKTKKGQPLGYVSKKITSSGQSLYIDLKHKNFSNGIVSCKLDVEGTVFNLSSQFYNSKGGVNNFINVKKK